MYLHPLCAELFEFDLMSSKLIFCDSFWMLIIMICSTFIVMVILFCDRFVFFMMMFFRG